MDLARYSLKRRSYQQYRFFYAARTWLVRHISETGILVLLCGLVLALFGLDTNLTVAYQAFAFAVALVLLALLGTGLGRVRFSAARVLPRFVSVGTPMTYQVRIRNHGRRPLRDLRLLEEFSDPRPSLEAFLNTPEPGEERRNWIDRSYGFYRWQWLVEWNQRAQVRECTVPSCLPGGDVEVPVELVPRRRGVLRFEAVLLACPDPLGLFRRLSRHAQADKLLVLPRRHPIPHFELPGKMKYQQGGVALAASVGESEEFVSLRDYRAGDPMRHIHWRSWARAGRPIVKEFQDEFFVRHALILDTFDLRAQSEVFEEAVSVAASFACTIQTQDSLLDLMFVGSQAYCFTAGRGLAHTEQMLEVLAAVEPSAARPFTALTNAVLEHLPVVSGCICVLLAWDAPRREFVSVLRAAGVPLVVFVVTEAGAPGITDLGPLADQPGSFHQLTVGRVGEALARLS